jgi:hypothetical protein
VLYSEWFVRSSKKSWHSKRIDIVPLQPFSVQHYLQGALTVDLPPLAKLRKFSDITMSRAQRILSNALDDNVEDLRDGEEELPYLNEDRCKLVEVSGQRVSIRVSYVYTVADPDQAVIDLVLDRVFTVSSLAVPASGCDSRPF